MSPENQMNPPACVSFSLADWRPAPFPLVFPDRLPFIFHLLMGVEMMLLAPWERRGMLKPAIAWKENVVLERPSKAAVQTLSVFFPHSAPCTPHPVPHAFSELTCVGLCSSRARFWP